MSLVSLEDFKRLDIRIGKVVEATRVEGSRKLIKLIVDLGAEKRQVIAGLAEFYRPEDLVGKYVVVLANLQPKKIMGLESQGMILATCDKPVLLSIEKGGDEHVGERVC
ncbi:methionine--tRNA ligase subunit beta [Pyrobaculum aerophilum]|uniref:Methionine--tRNA ligase n=2 Tax=Pyrobaculum aerophilum TaxID=13773 RepID=Q8ZU53_PYRAE|nr:MULTISPECIES: methionine--tRNA ligase subunit beta [Pyrobaculum]AAL64555.1 methionyl-tRNA synthetase beta subunit [Pyrobaculum aerophilum str. IM2]MCX8136053.1 methionine--tRNA ligase subunit beta [Pyrobaculum aerophilum]HII47398.1 methionine--tRNA ligase subunit beta [Pyrobaculum aerophilum]